MSINEPFKRDHSIAKHTPMIASRTNYTRFASKAVLAIDGAQHSTFLPHCCISHIEKQPHGSAGLEQVQWSRAIAAQVEVSGWTNEYHSWLAFQWAPFLSVQMAFKTMKFCWIISTPTNSRRYIKDQTNMDYACAFVSSDCFGLINDFLLHETLSIITCQFWHTCV